MHNVFLILGTTIGAGVYSLPSVVVKIGIWPFIVLATILAILLARINIFYRKVVEKFSEKHQLPGYVNLVMGKKFSRIATFLLLFSTYGAIVAYLVIGGRFIAKLVPVSAGIGSAWFYLAMFVLLFFSGKLLEKIDYSFVFLKMIFLLLVLIIALLLFSVQLTSLTIGNISQINVILGYGAILFALTGFSIVPELKKQTNITKSIIGTQGAILLVYIVFAVLLSPHVNKGEFIVTNPILSFVFNVAGLLCVTTPYLMLSWVIYDIYSKDLKFKKRDSMLLTLIVPLFALILGINDFMQIMSVTGGVFLGAIAVLIVVLYQKLFPGKNRLEVLIIKTVFILGIVAELVGVFYH
jgi:tyrosine-specific transport protein